MKGQSQKCILPFSCERLYALVAAVKSYPDFLPWCTGAVIHEESPEEMTADLCIGYGFFSETFTSQVRLKPNESIEVDCIKGPFNKLKNRWVFNPVGEDQTEIEFTLEYEFSNPLFQKAMDGIYHKAFDLMTDAFEKRAREMYGT